MSADVAELEWYKFCNSLEHLQTEEPLGKWPLISVFVDIRSYLQEKLKLVSPNKSLKLLCQLNGVLADFQIFRYYYNQSHWNILRFNPLTKKLFMSLMHYKLSRIKVGFEDLLQHSISDQSLPQSLADEALYENGGDVIGFDEMADEIENVLLREDNINDNVNFITYGITGTASSGKTTLARKVFNSDRIHKEYPTRIWVCLSDMTDQIEIVKNMLTQKEELPDNIHEEEDICSLLAELKKQLSERKYLIVLDGARQEHSWFANFEKTCNDSLCCALPKGGTVIVTSRGELSLGDYRFVTRLDQDNEMLLEACLKIFQDSVEKYGKIKMDHPRLVMLEDDIKYKVRGLPLAAKKLAQIISDQIKQRWSWVI